MENLEEKLVRREEIFGGTVLHVVRDTVLLPNGKEAIREISLHNGAVAIIPVLPNGKILMERQYRYAHGRVFLEIPAGKLDYVGEDPEEAAKRELREETGALAGKITFLGQIDTAPALISEKIQLYLAEELTFGERELDEDEFLALEEISIDDLVDMVMSGEIKDSKTQIAILKYDKIRRGLSQ